MKNFLNVLPLLIGAIAVFFVVRTVVQMLKDQKSIRSHFKEDSLQTEDLKIFSTVAISFIVNFKRNYQYAKFYFIDGEVYILLRNDYPKDSYFGPLVLKENGKTNYSYFTTYRITNFQITGSDVKLSFKPKKFIGTRYHLYIQNISVVDLDKIKSNLTYY